MKTIKLLFAGAFLFLFVFVPAPVRAQADTANMAKNALLYADSLSRVDSLELFEAYANLTPASVIKYYGGRPGFIDHIRLSRERSVSTQVENAPQFKVMQLKNVLNEEWQCVIRETRDFHKVDQKYHFVTYFVGQSKDDGETWKLFDVSYNKVANVIAMFPEVFGDLTINEAVIQVFK